MGLGNLSATDNIYAKAIEMNVLALDHAIRLRWSEALHHLAKRLQVMSILPQDVQKIIQCIIESGSGSHCFCC